jgi:hypothetical protein
MLSMSEPTARYTIHFPDWYDDLAAMEHEAKGYLGGVIVRFADDARYELFFIDPVRLQQDLEEAVAAGQSWFAEPNMIVVKDTTRAAIEKAVAQLAAEDFFGRLGSRSRRLPR